MSVSMEIADIRDEETLERWLNDQPREFGLAIAHRSALRAAPFGFWALGKERIGGGDISGLPLFRVAIALAVVRQSPFSKVSVLLSGTLKGSAKEAQSRAFATGEGMSFGGVKATDAFEFAIDAVPPPADEYFDGSNVYSAVESLIMATEDFYAAAKIWEQVRDDARLLDAGNDLHTTPLWSIPHLDWFTDADREARAIWAKEPEVWDFWVRWWDGVLSGKPLPWDLQEQIALIDNKDWEKGPAHIAGVIKGIEDKFRCNSNEALAETLLGAAIADYSFDSIDRVMRLVPFEEDIRHLRDPKRLNPFLDDADSFRDDLKLFCEGLAAEGAMQGAGFVRTYLNGVLEELSRARQMNHLRVGRIVELGKILEEFSLDSHTAAEFGPVAKAFRSHVTSLLDLTRRHFASTLTRMAPLRDLSTSPDDNQWDLLQDIQRGIKALVPTSDDVPPLVKDDQQVLLSLTESIERLLRQHDALPDGPAKASLQREINHGLALVTVSVALGWEESKRYGKVVGRRADFVLKNFKRGMGIKEIWDLVKPFLGL